MLSTQKRVIFLETQENYVKSNFTMEVYIVYVMYMNIFSIHLLSLLKKHFKIFKNNCEYFHKYQSSNKFEVK